MTKNKEEAIVKPFALTAALALMLGAALPASAIEVLTNNAVLASTAQRQPDLTAAPARVETERLSLSELPEPEVLAMMLVGLVLIGYRASRDSNEKFK